MVVVSKSHRQRVQSELRKAGVSPYGQGWAASRFMPEIIYEHEHICGAVHGMSATGYAMLVATDERILYVVRRPLFRSVDELTYDVVTGVRLQTAGMFSSVDLHTRLGNYTLRYISPVAGRIFVDFIEERVEHVERDGIFAAETKKEPGFPRAEISVEARQFLESHKTAVLSSANRTGDVHGAAVYYLFDPSGSLYFLTKAGTNKAHDMLSGHSAAMTIYDEEKMQTAQINGRPELEHDNDKKFEVFRQLSSYHDSQNLPPVAQLTEGEFIVFKLEPQQIKFHDFKNNN